MSINIQFEPDGQSGLVAEGSYLLDAARRIGVNIPAECEGRGECDSCVVNVVAGAALLSSLTSAEHKQLGSDRIASGARLACQARLEHTGDLVIRLAPVEEKHEGSAQTKDELSKGFRDLPLDKKMTTLAELEAVTMMQTINTILAFPFSMSEKVLDLLAGKGRLMNKRDRESRRPAEHRSTADSKSGTGSE